MKHMSGKAFTTMARRAIEEFHNPASEAEHERQIQVESLKYREAKFSEQLYQFNQTVLDIQFSSLFVVTTTINCKIFALLRSFLMIVEQNVQTMQTRNMRSQQIGSALKSGSVPVPERVLQSETSKHPLAADMVVDQPKGKFHIRGYKG
jgi:small-conductance mechanosensitive channel